MCKYYAHIRNNEILDVSNCKYLDKDILNIEISQEVFNNIEEYIYQDNKIVLNPDYESEQLAKAKESKYQEANTGAKAYLESGNALFELTETQHIEATDGNIGKLGAYSLNYVTGRLQPDDVVYWNTKEDETIALTQEQLSTVLMGIGEVQAQVWNVKFPAYKAQIEACATAEEVNAIVIDYSLPLQQEKEESAGENQPDENYTGVQEDTEAADV